MSSVRESFVARFGEADAVAIEAAAGMHQIADGLGVHNGDNHGSDPFKYWFLTAIGWECVSRYRDSHGITATEADLREWALYEGELGSFDGDVPDALALFCGAYEDWILPDAMTVRFGEGEAAW